jgi:hypothetical protein
MDPTLGLSIERLDQIKRAVSNQSLGVQETTRVKSGIGGRAVRGENVGKNERTCVYGRTGYFPFYFLSVGFLLKESIVSDFLFSFFWLLLGVGVKKGKAVFFYVIVCIDLFCYCCSHLLLSFDLLFSIGFAEHQSFLLLVYRIPCLKSYPCLVYAFSPLVS